MARGEASWASRRERIELPSLARVSRVRPRPAEPRLCAEPKTNACAQTRSISRHCCAAALPLPPAPRSAPHKTCLHVLVLPGSQTSADGACTAQLHEAVELVRRKGATAAGRQQLAAQFHLCKPLDAAQPLVDFVTDALETIPQV